VPIKKKFMALQRSKSCPHLGFVVQVICHSCATNSKKRVVPRVARAPKAPPSASHLCHDKVYHNLQSFPNALALGGPRTSIMAVPCKTVSCRALFEKPLLSILSHFLPMRPFSFLALSSQSFMFLSASTRNVIVMVI
jgi:hypothetical protein